MSILQVNNVSKSLGKQLILDNVSFSINEGEIVGFIGPNGAGKTTTIRIMTNMVFPDKGNVIIDNHNLLKEREKALSNMSAIVENPGLNNSLSGLDNLNFIRRLNNVSIETMNNIIEYTGLTGRIKDKVKKYSLGMKQRLALGMCLLTEPKLLILDEPTNGLDPIGIIELRSTLTSLSNKKKTAILISSHNLSEIEKICDRFIFIKDGKIIAEQQIKLNNDIKTYKLEFENIFEVSELLNRNGYDKSIYQVNDNTMLINLDKKLFSSLLNLISSNGIVFNVELVESDLEAQYAKIYQGVN